MTGTHLEVSGFLVDARILRLGLFFLACHTLVWFLFPTFFSANVPYDTAEGLAWGRAYAWGYDKHPPLAPWLTAWVTDVLGQGTPGWPTYALSQGCVLLCFFFIYRTAKVLRLASSHALFSALSLTAIYYYNTGAIPFNPNVLMLPLWAAVSYFFLRSLQHPDRLDCWGLLGLSAGLALLAKYESLVLLAALSGITPTARGRRILKKAGPYLAFGITLTVIMPHLIWLHQQHYITLEHSKHHMLHEKSFSGMLAFLKSPMRFSAELLGALLPMLWALWPIKKEQKQPSSRPLQTGGHSMTLEIYEHHFLWLVALGPWLITLIFASISGAYLHAMWGFPFLSFVPMLVLQRWGRVHTDRDRCVQALRRLTVVASMIFVLHSAYHSLAPRYASRIFSHEYPGKALAQALENLWQQRFHRPLAYIGGSLDEVAHGASYGSSKPQAFFYGRFEHNSWVLPEELSLKGAVFVWKRGKTVCEGAVEGDASFQEFHGRFPTLKPYGTLKIRTAGASEKYLCLGVAWLAPGGKHYGS